MHNPYAMIIFAAGIMLISCALPVSADDSRAICGSDDKENISCNCVNWEGAVPVYYSAGRPVARLRYKMNDEWWVGTGFLVGDRNYLLTCYHCIKGSIQCNTLTASFNYELDENSNGRTAQNYGCVRIVCQDSALDYTLIELDGDAVATYGSLPLIASTLSDGDPLRVIQHPGGRRKEISVAGCYVWNAVAPNPTRFEHECDAEGGSSGSPVLNEDLNVVGLHNGSGIGDVCPNRGVLMKYIVADIAAKGVDIGPPLSTPGCPPADVNGGCGPTGSRGCGPPVSGPPPCPGKSVPPALPPGGVPDDEVLARLSVLDDLTVPGEHMIVLDTLGVLARQGLVCTPEEECIETDIGDAEASASIILRNLFSAEGEEGGGQDQLSFELLEVDGMVGAFIPAHAMPPPLGISTGTNNFDLDTARMSMLTIEGTSGQVPMYGDVNLLLTNDFFTEQSPAPITLYFGGYYDFFTGEAVLTDCRWVSHVTFGRIPTLTEWGIILFAVLLFALLAYRVLKRRSAVAV